MAPTTVPAALKEGDTIAFISPSERLNSIFPAALNRAKIYIDSLGFKVKIIFDPTPSSNFREAVLKRCDEVHAAFRDPEVKAILCTVGGTTANELLRFLDYDLIKANPKIFCGYSDITVLHYAIFTQTGLQTFYGATAIAEFGEFPEPLDFTAKDFLKVLKDSADRPIGLVPRSLEWTQDLPGFFFGKDTKGPRNLDPAPGWTWLRAGKAKGRIFGGCLSVVLRLKGTKYWADHRGKILLLENPSKLLSKQFLIHSPFIFRSL
jgi:muramoyltetrapeptide carboxypeptidase